MRASYDETFTVAGEWSYPKTELLGFLQDQGFILTGLQNVCTVRDSRNAPVTAARPPTLPQKLRISNRTHRCTAQVFA
ncbi:uncharacterized protein PHALS_11555 [Plasmopara halstedii]|uniref:Uncharacterized protein n=1 Tax=Plasmopara halstedii TaxID=4781 RepID=A0A0P1AIY6_PLAHL|nr:uncharacterized protein PHALS_11555 [Plasmopara halstedii]CEG41191.1 hypothetical protein PHALS_11555 [Plasmopara halstedii]|eukprot:XP_024577560.1 hypothetical protein PHALS_11555 [Plasmopara halstedii]